MELYAPAAGPEPDNPSSVPSTPPPFGPIQVQFSVYGTSFSSAKLVYRIK